MRVPTSKIVDFLTNRYGWKGIAAEDLISLAEEVLEYRSFFEEQAKRTPADLEEAYRGNLRESD